MESSSQGTSFESGCRLHEFILVLVGVAVGTILGSLGLYMGEKRGFKKGRNAGIREQIDRQNRLDLERRNSMRNRIVTSDSLENPGHTRVTQARVNRDPS